MRQLIPMLAVLTACGGPNGGPDSAATDVMLAEAIGPRLIEPVNDELTITVARTDALEFEVADVLSITTVVLDGVDLGASPGGRAAQLTPETLVIRLGGGMVPSAHTLQLRHVIHGQEAASRTVSIRVEGALAPSITLTLATEPSFVADRLIGGGRGRADVLAGIEWVDSKEPSAQVFRGEDLGWSLETSARIPLPGLRADATARTIAIAPERPSLPNSEAAPPLARIRIAWHSNAQSTQLRFVNALWEGPTYPPRIALSLASALDETLLGAAEYGQLGQPVIVGDHIVAELLRASDIEQPHPGDRVLVTVPIETNSEFAGAARVSQFAPDVDIDALGEVLDLQQFDIPRNTSSLLAVRHSGSEARLARLDHRTGLILGQPASDTHVLAQAQAPHLTVLGALNTRQVFALDRDSGSALTLVVDGPGGKNADGSAPGQAQLDMSAATGPGSASVAAGVPLFIVPMGQDTPAFVLVSIGVRAKIVTLDELRCDDIVLRYSVVANRAGQTALACRRGRDVLLGTLKVTPPQ